MILLEVGVGKTYSTIQDAVDAIISPLVDRYKVSVYNGVYSGFVVAGKDTSLSNYIEIERADGSLASITGDIDIQSQYVLVRGFGISAFFKASAGASYSGLIECALHDYYAGDYLLEIASGVSDFLVDACLMYNANNSILVAGELNNKIQNSVIRDVTGYAIETAVGGIDPTIVNNTLVDNGTAIRYRGGQVARIRNNNITHNINGIVMTSPLTPDDSIKSNNNVWNNTNNYVNTTGGNNAHSFDPKYTNYSGNDFRIGQTSPCVDNGSSIDVPNRDFDGKSRPRLLGYDVGAFEYSTENVAPSVVIFSMEQRADGSGYVEARYIGVDQNYDVCSLTQYEYSLTGAFAGEEQQMTPVETDPEHNNISNLHFSFTGDEFCFVWDSVADVGQGFDGNIYIRLVANDGVLDSNIATFNNSVDNEKPIVNVFQIDTSTEEEEDVTLTGTVDLQIGVLGNVTSMKFSNNGMDWTDYEAYASVKSDWDLINGFGGQAYQGLKKVYIKVKDDYGNETDGTLWDSTWYKLTPASVENLRTAIKYHSLRTAIGESQDNDTLEVQTDDTFFTTGTIVQNGLSIIVADGYTPTVDMNNLSGLHISGVNGFLIQGLILIGANREVLRITDSSNVNVIRNVFDHEYGIYANPSSFINIRKNIFKDGIKSIELSNCIDTEIKNNTFARISELVIELGDSPSEIVNNTFVDCGNVIENLLPNDDQSIVRNNIFYSNGVVINANPLWIIENNDFWDNDENFSGLVPRLESGNNIVADPLFRDYENDDFYLLEDSLCINSGTMDSAPTDDFNDIERKQDIGYDIGAFEFFPVPEYVYNTGNVLQQDNVKNVFIYDTSKDTGSEWKTDLTASWNQEIGHFPDIAYIVVTDDGIDIVNSEDNTLWMRFSSAVDNAVDGDSEINTAFALNGVLYFSKGKRSSNPHQGLVIVDFVNDEIRNAMSTGSNLYNGDISSRNAGSGYSVSTGADLVGDDVKSIGGIRVGGNDCILVGTDSGISVIKDVNSSLHYLSGESIDKVCLVDGGNAYFIYNNTIGVLYSVHEDSIGKISPDYIYSDSPIIPTAPKILPGVLNDLVVMSDESEYQDLSGILSNLIYVATDYGVTLIHTSEADPLSSEKWGFSKHYGIEESTKEGLNFKVFLGSVSDFHHLGISSDIMVFVAKDAGNDIFYVYNRRAFKIRLERTTSLPSRNITAIDFVEVD